MNNTEAKLISALLKDKQVHALLQANVDNLLQTHKDIWQFIKKYYEINTSVPPTTLVVEKFRDFEPIEDIGTTKYHLEELQAEYLNNNLKESIYSNLEIIKNIEEKRAQEFNPMEILDIFLKINK